MSENEGIIIISCLIFIPAICVSLAAKQIFNLFLQLNPKNKLLITSSSPIQNIIVGNYVAGLVIAIISSSYLFICLLLILDSKSSQASVSFLLAIIAGVSISTVTFLPVIDRQRLNSLPVIYQLGVGGLGLINIGFYLSTNQIGSLGKLFFWLVFLSPIFAIYSSRKY
jgi:hypothetical protein